MAVGDLLQTARVGAATAVNRHHFLRNWLTGSYIVDYEKNGEDRAAYGSALPERLAQDLCARGMKGLGVSMLRMTRRFCEIYPQIRQSVIAEFTLASDSQDTPSQTPLPPAGVLRFSWTHLIELIRIDDPWKCAFYENECLKSSWSVRQLQRQTGSLLYERTGLSTDKQTVIARAREQALEAPGQIADLIRDPYVLEFIGLTEQSHYLEKDLENALLDHLQSFMLELGTGFCFEARQKRVTVGSEHDYLDLVFYHRILRCHLLIDLKTRSFAARPDEARPAKVIIAILTDGLENASREYTQKHIADLITGKRAQGWEFVFLAANQDAIATATSLRIDAADALIFAASPQGTDLAFQCMSDKVSEKRRK